MERAVPLVHRVQLDHHLVGDGGGDLFLDGVDGLEAHRRSVSMYRISFGFRSISAGRSRRRSSARDAGCTSNCRSRRSEEHTSELQSLMRISYAVFCLKKNKNQ